MKKTLVILVMFAVVTSTAVAENVSVWKSARAATAGEATVSVVNVGGGNYEVTIAVANTPGIYGIASFAIELVGAATISNMAPMAGFIDPNNAFQPAPGAGFTILRSAANIALLTGSQDTVDSLTPDTHRHYGFGQTTGDLAASYGAGLIMNTSVQPAYGAPGKVAEGSGRPTLGQENRVMIFVPEPATMSLLGLGGLVTLLRRKR